METETMLRCEADADAATEVVVLDESRSNEMPTGRVTVTCPAGVTDGELAEVAGFGPRHFGWTVSRYDDGTAVVHLWND